MSSYYCKECGEKTSSSSGMPKFCGSCGQGFLNDSTNNKKPQVDFSAANFTPEQKQRKIPKFLLSSNQDNIDEEILDEEDKINDENFLNILSSNNMRNIGQVSVTQENSVKKVKYGETVNTSNSVGQVTKFDKITNSVDKKDFAKFFAQAAGNAKDNKGATIFDTKNNIFYEGADERKHKKVLEARAKKIMENNENPSIDPRQPVKKQARKKKGQ